VARHDRADLRCPPAEKFIPLRQSPGLAGDRKAVKARGHFPTEAAAMKCVYLAVMSLDATGRGRQRWTNRWKPALNAFTIAFPGRTIPTTK